MPSSSSMASPRRLDAGKVVRPLLESVGLPLSVVAAPLVPPNAPAMVQVQQTPETELNESGANPGGMTPKQASSQVSLRSASLGVMAPLRAGAAGSTFHVAPGPAAMALSLLFAAENTGTGTSEPSRDDAASSRDGPVLAPFDVSDPAEIFVAKSRGSGADGMLSGDGGGGMSGPGDGKRTLQAATGTHGMTLRLVAGGSCLLGDSLVSTVATADSEDVNATDRVTHGALSSSFQQFLPIQLHPVQLAAALNVKFKDGVDYASQPVESFADYATNYCVSSNGRFIVVAYRLRSENTIVVGFDTFASRGAVAGGLGSGISGKKFLNVDHQTVHNLGLATLAVTLPNNSHAVQMSISRNGRTLAVLCSHMSTALVVDLQTHEELVADAQKVDAIPATDLSPLLGGAPDIIWANLTTRSAVAELEGIGTLKNAVKSGVPGEMCVSMQWHPEDPQNLAFLAKYSGVYFYRRQSQNGLALQNQPMSVDAARTNPENEYTCMAFVQTALGKHKHVLLAAKHNSVHVFDAGAGTRLKTVLFENPSTFGSDADLRHITTITVAEARSASQSTQVIMGDSDGIIYFYSSATRSADQTHAESHTTLFECGALTDVQPGKAGPVTAMRFFYTDQQRHVAMQGLRNAQQNENAGNSAASALTVITPSATATADQRTGVLEQHNVKSSDRQYLLVTTSNGDTLTVDAGAVAEGSMVLSARPKHSVGGDDDALFAAPMPFICRPLFGIRASNDFTAQPKPAPPLVCTASSAPFMAVVQGGSALRSSHASVQVLCFAGMYFAKLRRDSKAEVAVSAVESAFENTLLSEATFGADDVNSARWTPHARKMAARAAAKAPLVCVASCSQKALGLEGISSNTPMHKRDDIMSVALSSDGSKIVFGTKFKIIFADVSMVSGELSSISELTTTRKETIGGENSGDFFRFLQVSHVAYSSDGGLIAACCNNGTDLALIDASTRKVIAGRKLLLNKQRPLGSVSQLNFAPDDGTVFVVGQNGSALELSCSSNALARGELLEIVRRVDEKVLGSLHRSHEDNEQFSTTLSVESAVVCTGNGGRMLVSQRWALPAGKGQTPRRSVILGRLQGDNSEFPRTTHAQKEAVSNLFLHFSHVVPISSRDDPGNSARLLVVSRSGSARVVDILDDVEFQSNPDPSKEDIESHRACVVGQTDAVKLFSGADANGRSVHSVVVSGDGAFAFMTGACGTMFVVRINPALQPVSETGEKLPTPPGVEFVPGNMAAFNPSSGVAAHFANMNIAVLRNLHREIASASQAIFQRLFLGILGAPVTSKDYPGSALLPPAIQTPEQAPAETEQLRLTSGAPGNIVYGVKYDYVKWLRHEVENLQRQTNAQKAGIEWEKRIERLKGEEQLAQLQKAAEETLSQRTEELSIEMKQLKEKQAQAVEELKELHAAKLLKASRAEKELNERLQADLTALHELKEKHGQVEETYMLQINHLKENLTQKEKEVEDVLASAAADIEAAQGKVKHTEDQLEADREAERTQLELEADLEIEQMKHNLESELEKERTGVLQVRGENSWLQKQSQILQRDLDHRSEQMLSLQHRERTLVEANHSLQEKVSAMNNAQQLREHTLSEKETRIVELKKRNQELEKLKFVLDYTIEELKRKIDPLEAEITKLQDQIRQMDSELERYHKNAHGTEVDLRTARGKTDSQAKMLQREQKRVQDAKALMSRMRSGIHSLMAHYQSPAQLKQAVKDLNAQFVSEQQGEELNQAEEETDVHQEYIRQRDYLERSISQTKRQLAKESEQHRLQRAKLMQENVLLINEINALRRELKIKDARGTIQDMEKGDKNNVFLTKRPVGGTRSAERGRGSPRKSSAGSTASPRNSRPDSARSQASVTGSNDMISATGLPAVRGNTPRGKQ